MGRWVGGCSTAVRVETVIAMNSDGSLRCSGAASSTGFAAVTAEDARPSSFRPKAMCFDEPHSRYLIADNRNHRILWFEPQTGMRDTLLGPSPRHATRSLPVWLHDGCARAHRPKANVGVLLNRDFLRDV